MFSYFFVDAFSGSFLHPSVFYIQHSRSGYITNGALTDSCLWINIWNVIMTVSQVNISCVWTQIIYVVRQ